MYQYIKNEKYTKEHEQVPIFTYITRFLGSNPVKDLVKEQESEATTAIRIDY